jgi:ClpP class serine protease
VSFTDDLCASAGYYLFVAGTSHFATASSDVGCIGTLCTWVDVSKRMEMEGFKREMIASGKYKGMLFPGLEMTEAQREYLEDRVDYLSTEFKNWVLGKRPDVKETAMEGQVIIGSLAVAEGLIDEIASFEDALNEAQELIQ